MGGTEYPCASIRSTLTFVNMAKSGEDNSALGKIIQRARSLSAGGSRGRSPGRPIEPPMRNQGISSAGGTSPNILLPMDIEGPNFESQIGDDILSEASAPPQPPSNPLLNMTGNRDDLIQHLLSRDEKKDELLSAAVSKLIQFFSSCFRSTELHSDTQSEIDWQNGSSPDTESLEGVFEQTPFEPFANHHRHLGYIDCSRVCRQLGIVYPDLDSNQLHVSGATLCTPEDLLTTLRDYFGLTVQVEPQKSTGCSHSDTLGNLNDTICLQCVDLELDHQALVEQAHQVVPPLGTRVSPLLSLPLQDCDIITLPAIEE